MDMSYNVAKNIIWSDFNKQQVGVINQRGIHTHTHTQTHTHEQAEDSYR